MEHRILVPCMKPDISPLPAAQRKDDASSRLRNATRLTGVTGEDIAARHLEALGYRVLHRNLRVGRGEVDILGHDPRDNVLVFAEVKTRSRDGLYRPELNLTRRKRRAMTLAAARWVNRNGYEGGYRMDLICIAGGRVSDHFIELDGVSGSAEQLF